MAHAVPVSQPENDETIKNKKNDNNNKKSYSWPT